jgi:ferredoxin
MPNSNVKVWLDSKACLTSGQCEETAPLVFQIGDDYQARLRRKPDSPEVAGEAGAVDVPEELLDDVEQAARECPAQCIHLID